MGMPAFQCPDCSKVHLWKVLRELSDSHHCPDCGDDIRNVPMTLIRDEEDVRRDEARSQEETQAKAVFARVAVEAKSALSGLQDDVLRACLFAVIDVLCKSGFRRWRADARGKACPEQYSPEGTSEAISSVCDEYGLSRLDAVRLQAEAEQLVQMAYMKVQLGS